MLEKIYAAKLQEVATLPHDLAQRVDDLPPTRGFLQAIRAAQLVPALIAEVKKASPSQGLIRADFDPVAIAQEYELAGATCLSVLTDEPFFQGSSLNLQLIRKEVDLPLLRKDFIIDSRQVYESRFIGADAILLIARWLELSKLIDLYQCAKSIGLDVLVETHDEPDVEKAIGMNADLVGVNNRDLSTFQVDLATSERLLPMLAPGVSKVAESALKTKEDVMRVQQAGANAVLIGTTFCGHPHIAEKVREVMPWPST